MIKSPPDKPNPLKLCEDCGEHVALGRIAGERVEYVCGFCARQWSLFAFPASGYYDLQEALDRHYLDEARRLNIPEGLRRRPAHRGYPGSVETGTAIVDSGGLRDIMDVFRSDEAMQAFGVERPPSV